MAGLIA